MNMNRLVGCTVKPVAVRNCLCRSNRREVRQSYFSPLFMIGISIPSELYVFHSEFSFDTTAECGETGKKHMGSIHHAQFCFQRGSRPQSHSSAVCSSCLQPQGFPECTNCSLSPGSVQFLLGETLGQPLTLPTSLFICKEQPVLTPGDKHLSTSQLISWLKFQQL